MKRGFRAPEVKVHAEGGFLIALALLPPEDGVPAVLGTPSLGGRRSTLAMLNAGLIFEA